MDLLYRLGSDEPSLEDDFFYESKTLGKVIELLQLLDLDKEFSLCETRAMNRKPCDNRGLMITKQEFKKNAGLCRDCVEDDLPCEARQ